MFCAFETTRDFHALLPVMLVCVIADAVTYYMLPSSIMTQKFAKRDIAVSGDYGTEVLKSVWVSDIMRKDVAAIPPEMPVSELAARMARGQPGFNLTQGIPIVRAEGQLVGIVTQGDLLRALERDPTGAQTVAQANGHPLIVAYPDELAHNALLRMVQNDVSRLPVVSREDGSRLIGYVNRASFLNVWKRQIDEEFVREHGWIRQFWRPRVDIEPEE